MFSADSLWVLKKPPIFPPLLPGPSAWACQRSGAQHAGPPRERTQGRRARRERCINKITLVFHLGEADCLLLFSLMQM